MNLNLNDFVNDNISSLLNTINLYLYKWFHVNIQYLNAFNEIIHPLFIDRFSISTAIPYYLDKLNNYLEQLAKILNPFTTPLALLYIAKTITQRIEENKRQQDEANRQDDILAKYLEQIATLIASSNLATLKHDNAIVKAAQALTVTAFLRLNSTNSLEITNFLVNSNLAIANSDCPAILKNCNFSHKSISHYNFSLLNLSIANFSQADLSYAHLNDTNLTRTNFCATNLKGANLNNANLSEAILNSANLINADLSGANLKGANLNAAYLKNANLRSAYLRAANLSISDLSNTTLIRAYLRSANLCQAYLEKANLRGANLSATNLSGAYLVNAELGDADLSGANLSGTNLCGAKFNETYLTFTNLIGAIGLKVEQIKKAINWESAIFSEEFKQKLDRSK